MTTYTNYEEVLPETLREGVEEKVERWVTDGRNDHEAAPLMRSLVLEAYACGKANGLAETDDPPQRMTAGRYDDNTWGVYDGTGTIVVYGFAEKQDAYDWIEREAAEAKGWQAAWTKTRKREQELRAAALDLIRLVDESADSLGSEWVAFAEALDVLRALVFRPMGERT